MRVPRWFWAVPIAAATCICSNKLGGDLKLNGQPFSPSSCRNGAVFGFAGVEISGAGGWKLRLVQTPTGEAKVVVFKPAVEVGVELGVCGTIKHAPQNSTVNNVQNVHGTAALSCAADGITLAGKLTYENCH